jgi:MFS family permease
VLPTRGPFLLGSLGVHNPLAVGAIMSLMTVASIPGALNYGRLRLRLDPMAIFAISWALMGIGMSLIALATNAGVLALGVVIMGLGMGPSMPNYMAYWMASVPPASRGRASSFLTTAFFAGQFASPLVTAPLAAAVGLPDTFLVLAAVQIGLALVLGVVALQGSKAARLGQTVRAHVRT